jgi:hypothetical protein
MRPLIEVDLCRPARCGRTNTSETGQRGHSAGQQRMSGGLADGVDCSTFCLSSPSRTRQTFAIRSENSSRELRTYNPRGSVPPSARWSFSCQQPCPRAGGGTQGYCELPVLQLVGLQPLTSHVGRWRGVHRVRTPKSIAFHSASRPETSGPRDSIVDISPFFLPFTWTKPLEGSGVVDAAVEIRPCEPIFVAPT